MRGTLLCLLLLGCARDKVAIECQPLGDSLSCSIKHIEESNTVNACFDVIISCRSESKATAHVCHISEPDQTATRTLQDADFSGINKCEPNGMSVSNIVVAVQ